MVKTVVSISDITTKQLGENGKLPVMKNQNEASWRSYKLFLHFWFHGNTVSKGRKNVKFLVMPS